MKQEQDETGIRWNRNRMEQEQEGILIKWNRNRIEQKWNKPGIGRNKEQDRTEVGRRRVKD